MSDSTTAQGNPTGTRRVPRRKSANTPKADRAAELTAVLQEAPQPTDHEAVRKHVHRLMELGVAVLPILPGDKRPVGWQNSDGQRGVYLATTDADQFDGYLKRYVEDHGADCAINLGVPAQASRLVVVDCDTEEQTEAFLADAGMPAGTRPTVTSPGSQDAEGNWVHTPGNGHFWFTVPDGVVLPTGIASMMVGGENGYAVKWGASYVLIPPSVRQEGPYAATGPVRELPNWLRDMITQHGQQRAQRATRARTEVNPDDPIAVWSANTSWADILAATGWMNTGKSDRCGCDIWTAPGLHASDKSATAHEVGCSMWDESPDPPLHIWTDHDVEPFDELRRYSATITRLQAYAAIHHGGDEAAALEALDLPHGLTEFEGKPKEAPVKELATVTLPPWFWESRPVLRHIRDAAWSMMASPDAVLAITMAKLAAFIPPRVRVDTGTRRPVPMHTFAALVGRSGGFKSSAMEAADLAADFVPEWVQNVMDTQNPVMVPVEDYAGGVPALVYVARLGTGQGIVENFMGEVPVLDAEGEPKKGRTATRRQQVRSNVLVTIDEGNGLAKALGDPNSIVGETLRELWTGTDSGQGNAKAENKRGVKHGTYSFSMIVGFQLSVLERLLGNEHLELGTPQRFLFAWTGAPDIPDDPVAAPGVLSISVPNKAITMCPSLLGHIRAVLLPLLRNAGTDVAAESQQLSVLVRMAALLGILDGRTEVSEEDWHLAATMAGTSQAIADYALSRKRERDTLAKQSRRADLVADAVAVHTATDGTPPERAAARIVTAIRDRGEMVGGVLRAKWSGEKGIRKSFNDSDRPDADAGLELLIANGTVRRVEEGNSTYVELVNG